MKVLLLNGSPRKEGCTYTALTEIAETLKKNGVEAEIFQAGDPSPENVAAAAAIMKEADALVVGSPVYWASPSGQIIEFMDKFASKGRKRYDPQTSRSSRFRKTCRYYCNSGCTDQIFHLPSDAGCIRKLLANGSR